MAGGSLRYRTICVSAKQSWSMSYNVHNLYGLTETNATYQLVWGFCGGFYFYLTTHSTHFLERSLMVRWGLSDRSFMVDPLSYFSFHPVLHDWCNKDRGMYYPVCGMVHIKEPLLLIDKSSLCGGSRFPFSLSEWSLTICLTPYNRR